MRDRSSLYICTESGKNTVIVSTSKSEFAIVSTAKAKDILGCMGHVIPFYQRKIAFLYVNSDSTRKAIEERYHVKEVGLHNSPLGINIKNYAEGVMQVRGGSQTIDIILREYQSVFEIAEYVKGANKIIYSPQNSLIEDEIFKKLLDDTSEVVFTQNGDFIHYRL